MRIAEKNRISLISRNGFNAGDDTLLRFALNLRNQQRDGFCGAEI
ncbi:hypothetical protein SDC9_161999 [bioreactor metagenome]|uniref:Uncharacterized protein n=1 Tax=bioreactor metagenome TaxID=1076179 RepID=A0A645FM91_9ZZZZ